MDGRDTMTGDGQATPPMALEGVLELGQLIAGPFATKLFGEFGADVIKMEPPCAGDPLRRWRVMRGDTSLWWHVQSRNKRSLALDLHTDKDVLIAGNGNSIFKRLMTVLGREDLGADPALAENDGRSQQAERIDGAIAQWTRRHDRPQVLEALEAARVPAGRPYTAADSVEDAHYRARQTIATIATDDGALKVPGVLPHLSRTPGYIGGGGPAPGAHTQAVLDELGIDRQTQAQLQARGVVYDGDGS